MTSHGTERAEDQTEAEKLEVCVGERLLRNQERHTDETHPMFNFIIGNVFQVMKVTPGTSVYVVTESGPDRAFGRPGQEYTIPERILTTEWFEKLMSD